MEYIFDEHRLDLGRREIWRRDDLVAVEPQVFDLLVYLLRNRDRVVSKDDLIEEVWGGRIVSESTLGSHLHAARKAIGDSGKIQRFIRTVPRKGIRFVAEVRETDASPAAEVAVSEARTLPLPDKPSIAVLPFDNMSDAPDQEYFTDGLVEEITTALARVRSLFVVSRNSCFTYKGKAVDVRRVGQELGVRYVLEGSVRRARDQVRIAVQLIETSSGNHLWAERFDDVSDNLFALQDDVASAVACRILPWLQRSEIERAGPRSVESLTAYDLYLRALDLFHRQTLPMVREAIALLERALTLDQNFAAAAALICECRVTVAAQGWAPVTADERAESVALARRAVDLGKNDPDALCWASFALSIFGQEHDVAAAAADRALALNPSSADAWNARGWIACYREDPFTAIDAFQHALRLSPVDPSTGYFKCGLALASFGAERFDDASRWAAEALAEYPGYSTALRVMVAACALLGRADEAGRWLVRLLELRPGLTLRTWRKSTTASGKTRELLEIGLRKAGLSEE